MPRAPELALVLVGLLSLGCSESGTPPTAATSVSAPLLARAAKPTSDTPIRWEIPYAADGSLKIQGSDNARTSVVSPATGASEAFVFDHGTCGVKALIFNNGGGDATVDPDNDWSGLKQAQKAACGGTPRGLKYVFPWGTVTNTTNDANVWAVGPHDNPGRAGVAVFNVGSQCGQLRYGSTDLAQRNLPQVASTLLSPAGAKRIWKVESTADAVTGQHLAYCTLSNQTYDMPFTAYIYEK